MGKIKITKKELKEDEVKTFLVRASTYLKENYTIVIIAIAVIVVAFIGFNLYRYRQNLVLEESNKLFTFAINLYERGLMTEEEAQRREEYLREAIRNCEQILRDYPNADIAPIALYLQGNAYYLLNDFDQSITIFQQYIETTPNNIEKAKGYAALGYAFENKFFYERTDQSILDQAMRAYERAIDLGGDSYIAYEAMLSKARLLELMDQKEKAVEIYEKVMADRKHVVEDFQKRVANLKEKGMDKTLEEEIVYQINNALQLFTFYKSAELELVRLEGSSPELPDAEETLVAE